MKAKYLLACGVIGPPLFIIAFLIEGATRADYNPLRHPVSSLSIGELGWMQQGNFFVTGLLIVLFSIGLRKALQPYKGATHIMLLLVGIGLIGAGFFTTDPIGGYPVNTPLLASNQTAHGILHSLFSMFVFICLPIACFKLRKKFLTSGEKGWAKYSLFTCIAMPAFFILAAIGFKQVNGFADIAGLLQRICIIIGWTWMMLLALHLRKKYKNALTPGL